MKPANLEALKKIVLDEMAEIEKIPESERQTPHTLTIIAMGYLEQALAEFAKGKNHGLCVVDRLAQAINAVDEAGAQQATIVSNESMAAIKDQYGITATDPAEIAKQLLAKMGYNLDDAPDIKSLLDQYSKNNLRN
jgi:hypothetical protein